MVTTRSGRTYDDMFDDDDLLDFETRERRETVAARMRAKRNIPVTISLARVLMYVQLLSPILLPFFLVAINTGNSGNNEAETTASTTTTTVAQAQNGGGGGGGGVLILGALVFFVALLIVASRLGRASTTARWLAIGVEGVILAISARTLLAGSGLGNGLILSLVLGGFALAIIGLLLSPSANKGFQQSAAVGDIDARFDIRNLQELDK